jgi:prepilin-type processing-associated H-X9-DG protein
MTGATKVLLGLAAFVLLFLLACAGLTWPLEALVALLLGWYLFLKRTLPQVTLDPSALWLAGIALVTAFLGAHGLVTWCVRADRVSAQQTGKQSSWHFRWTAAFVLIFVILFAAGIAMVGATHQAAWMALSKESPFEWHMGPFGDKSNLKALGHATYDYASKEDSFPPGATFDEYGTPLHGWQTPLLPYLGQEAMYKSIDLSVAWDDPRNRTPFGTEITAFLNPNTSKVPRQNSAGFALTHYAANGWLLGRSPAFKLKDITDGQSTTILAGDAAGNFAPWGHPVNWRDPMLGINKSTDGFGWPVPGDAGATFLFADGSVRFLQNNTSPKVLKALSTPNGGEPKGDQY